MLTATAPASPNTLQASRLSRSDWGWTCWYTVKPSVTIWWNTSGEHLDGFIFTQNGWVQSYGSRCVKPPVVVGDHHRPRRSPSSGQIRSVLTDKPVKGMC